MIYSLDNLVLREIKALRKALDYLPITGIDAAFIAMLQHKISSQTQEIEEYIKSEEISKQEALKSATQPASEPELKPSQGKKKI